MSRAYRTIALSLLVALGLGAVGPAAQAETITVPATGAYKQIDVGSTKAAMDVLMSGKAKEQEKVIAEIKASPDKYAPPIFYVLSKVLFDQGNKDDAAFWFYAGQLRARYDANRCADISARSAVAVLNQEFGGPINQYMFKDIPKLEAFVPKVVKWDEATAHNYDHRWINLHGMGAMLTGMGDEEAKGKALSLPASEWNAIAAKTRSDYMGGFREAMEQMKKQK